MILVAGEALIDLIGHEGDIGGYLPVVGGANANVAMALAKADVPHRFLARISSDSFGQKIRSHLQSYNVDLSLAVDWRDTVLFEGPQLLLEVGRDGGGG